MSEMERARFCGRRSWKTCWAPAMGTAYSDYWTYVGSLCSRHQRTGPSPHAVGPAPRGPTRRRRNIAAPHPPPAKPATKDARYPVEGPCAICWVCVAVLPLQRGVAPLLVARPAVELAAVGQGQKDRGPIEGPLPAGTVGVGEVVRQRRMCASVRVDVQLPVLCLNSRILCGDR